MKYFSQVDPEWKNENFFDSLSFGKYGCFVTCLAMFCDRKPTLVAAILRENECFENNGNLNLPKACEALNLQYMGTAQRLPNYPCIAETWYYDNPSTKVREQHFVVIFPDGSIFDPLGKNIRYPIESYRLIKGGKLDIREIIWNVVNGFYLNYYSREATTDEIENHTSAIYEEYTTSDHPEYAISNWVNKQKDEEEFKKDWSEINKNLTNAENESTL